MDEDFRYQGLTSSDQMTANTIYRTFCYNILKTNIVYTILETVHDKLMVK